MADPFDAVSIEANLVVQLGDFLMNGIVFEVSLDFDPPNPVLNQFLPLRLAQTLKICLGHADGIRTETLGDPCARLALRQHVSYDPIYNGDLGSRTYLVEVHRTNHDKRKE